MYFSSDILVNMSEYLNENEIINLSRTCTGYYNICNRYDVLKYHFDNFPFGINHRIRHDNKIERPLFTFGYCKRWINYVSPNKSTFLMGKIVSSEDVLKKGKSHTEKFYPEYHDGERRFKIIFEHDTSGTYFTDIKLKIVFDKTIQEKIFIPYRFKIGPVTILIETIDYYNRYSTLFNKSVIYNFNKCSYPILTGSQIIPTFLQKNNEISLIFTLPIFKNLQIQKFYIKRKIIHSKNNTILIFPKILNIPFVMFYIYDININEKRKLKIDLDSTNKIFKYYFNFRDNDENIIRYRVFEYLVC
jgi:hypothetical protein